MPLVESVTLIVYGWKNVQPGTLEWVFPSVAAAMHAARAMSNAVEWAVVAGNARHLYRADDAPRAVTR